MIFLIEYDRPKGAIIQILSFKDNDREKADTKRLEIELKLNRGSIGHEVVLLDAANENALHQTHRRYFEDAGQIGRSMGTAPL